MVEMLIAILVMTVGLLAVLTMQDVAINANSISMKLTVGTSLAQEALEDILSWKSDNTKITTTAANVVYDLDPNSAATTISVPGAGSYRATYSTTVGGTAGSGIPDGITRVVVTVTETGSGRRISVTGFKRTV